MVLQGMRCLLQGHAVQTILMELWPAAMDRVAPCEVALTLLLEAGYQASAPPSQGWRRAG